MSEKDAAVGLTASPSRRETRVIPFVDLRAQYQTIRDEVQAAVSGVLERADFILGEDVRRFEEEFARFCGVAHAVGVSSGTEAIRLAVEACGIGDGYEVITPANTYVGTAEGIAQAGATPVLVDVLPATYHLDPASVERAITPRTKAILPVHLYGQPVDMEPLRQLARAHHLAIIEDACQAHGASLRGTQAGALGEIGCFSFYPSKNLGAYGDGGMITTNDAAHAERIMLSRSHGEKVKYHHVVKGATSRLDTLQAAVLRVKLRHLEAWNERRRGHAARYREQLARIGLEGPVETSGTVHVYHVFVIAVDRRDELQQFLSSQGIHTGIHYPIPLHQQEAFRELRRRGARFTETERLAKRILSLPMFPELRDEQIDYVVEQIGRFYGRS